MRLCRDQYLLLQLSLLIDTKLLVITLPGRCLVPSSGDPRVSFRERATAFRDKQPWCETPYSNSTTEVRLVTPVHELMASFTPPELQILGAEISPSSLTQKSLN